MLERRRRRHLYFAIKNVEQKNMKDEGTNVKVETGKDVYTSVWKEQMRSIKAYLHT